VAIAVVLTLFGKARRVVAANRALPALPPGLMDTILFRQRPAVHSYFWHLFVIDASGETGRDAALVTG
jgi:hypothetical protein